MHESIDLTVKFHDIYNDEIKRGCTREQAIIAAGKAIGLMKD